MALHECQIIPVGNETDILTVPFFSGYEALRLRNLTGIGLGQISKREEGVRQLMLGKAVEEIGLILALVQRFFQLPAIIFKGDACVVTGDDFFASQFQRLI